MGMAASQARYLALTARKSNTEYEGQQINQARTALANQSANCFNQLLALEVPTAPSKSDYTELQYSYSDGDNASVIDSWQQLSSADPNYNYVVNHYYYSNVYTGSQKLLENPEVTTKSDVTQTSYNEIAKQKGIEEPTIYLKYNADGTISVMNGDGESVDDVQLASYTSLANVTSDTNLENAKKDVESKYGITVTDKDYGYQDANGTWHFALQEELEDFESSGEGLNDYTTVYEPAAVGNCKLTKVTAEDYLSDDNKDMRAELEQIVRDCPDTNLSGCFTNELGEIEYNGGVYSFQMNGKTYYTCEKDLYNSMQTNYEYGKTIENQEKLAYYTASDVNTKIEKTNNALLETDGNGRFTSVKFDDDSVVYSLNTETVTDEDAYQDAMNEYNYKVQQYEKTIADINAKTSIIQQEDRTLELRLKQLDTEQNALATEMEAVKKVIKDNVENTFKTFSD